ncbi:MAG: gliding motility protein GldL [Bacteroidota bacterium]|jgi:gliding motility-associated protein GldL|nr:gliding motility protein GldL [Bacteroidota bacterium]
MSKNKGGFKELFYSKLMPKIYGIGASIVIVGALFKIEHYPFASLLLGVGLGVEAIIFFLSAFEPKGNEPDWSKVYPELADDYDGPVATKRITDNQENGLTKKLDHMLESAKVGPELIDSLGKGMRNLSESVTKMTTLSSASVATEEYAKNVREASKSLVDMNRSYGTTITAMAEMTTASKDAKEYHNQVQTVTKNLSALNAVYELELQDANSHVKAMNKFYGNIATAMESMSQASKESDQFKGELSKLTSNLTSLNRVYGSMLSAMKG